MERDTRNENKYEEEKEKRLWEREGRGNRTGKEKSEKGCFPWCCWYTFPLVSMIKYHRWFNEMNSKHNPQSSFSTEDKLTFALKRLVSILRQRLRLKTSNISVSSETCYVLQNGSRKRRVEARPLSSLELFYLPFRHWLGPKEVSPSPAWARGGGVKRARAMGRES